MFGSKKKRVEEKKPPPVAPLPTAAAPEPVPIPVSNVAQAPTTAEDEEGIMFTGEIKDGRPVVKGGSVEKLVERLTFPAYADLEFLKAFMLTYRSFTTPLELMSMLKKRYMLDPPPGADPKTFDSDVLRPIRLRVYNCLKHWIQKGFYDFVDDEQLAAELNDFIKNTMVTTGMENAAKQLQKMFDRQASGEENSRKLMFSQTPPTPILPMNLGGSMGLMDINPEELARQLTLIEYDLYKKIKPWECLNQSWAKKDKENRAPNILAMIQRFNQVSNWVATEIVNSESLKQRAKVLQHVIEVAEYCKALNNFNAMMEIISGLQNSAVFRLKQTWAALPSKYNKSYTDMHQIMSREQNYKNARTFLHSVDPPCIPYLGVYLTDLTFIEDGNPDTLPDTGYINFVKRQKISQVISEIQQYQNTPYCLEPVVFIREYLCSVEALDENECYKKSLEREERAPAGGAATKRPTRSGTRPPPKEDATPEKEEPFDPENPYGQLEVIEGYPFGEPDKDTNIVLVKDSDQPLSPIKGGTVVKLVERVTYEKHQDMNYLLAFLMTYRTFMTPNELLDLLDKRFNMPKPKSPSAAQAARFTQQRQIPIHLRIFNALKFWVDKYGVDFVEDPELGKRCQEFVMQKVESNEKILKTPGEQIRKILDRRIAEGAQPPQVVMIGDTFSAEEAGKHGTVIDYDPIQIAERIVMLDQDLFKNISGRECLSGVWEGPKAEQLSPNIVHMRNHFDKIKRWVLGEIGRTQDCAQRGIVVSHFLRVAEYLFGVKAFNALVAIVHALMHAKWLTPTWEYVPLQLVQTYQHIHNIIKNPKKLREQEKSDDITTPTIPFLELYLRQLSGIHDMLPDTLTGDLVNFEKRRKIYDVYSVWQTFQTHPFTFDYVPAVHDYLLSVELADATELKRYAASVPNTPPPAQRPTMEDLPQPPKRPAAADQRSLAAVRGEGSSVDLTATGTDSAGYSPRGLDDSTTTQLKSVVLNVLAEDRQLLGDLIAEAKRELQDELLGGLRAYTASVHDEMIVMNGQYGLVDPAQVREAGKRIVARKFPGIEVQEWAALDTQGIVYGWQEEIYLFVADDGTVNRFLVSVSPHVDPAALGAILRMVDLYGTALGAPPMEAGYQVAVISPSVNEAACTIAQQRGVHIVAF